MLANLIFEFRYAVRGMIRQPGFSAVIVLTLAVGIAVNAAMFALFDALILGSVPGARDSDDLVNLSAPGSALKAGTVTCGLAGDCEQVFSYPMFRDLEQTQQSFSGIAAHRIVDTNLGFQSSTRPGTGVLVSGNYFDVLGVRPQLGRLLGPQDDAAEGVAEAVVLSYAYWQAVLGADPAVVGERLVVNGKPLTIVGVAPRGFHGTTRPLTPDVFLPITFRWREDQSGVPNFDDRRNYWVYLFARLKAGVSLEQAEMAINQPYQAILSEVEAPLQFDMSEQERERFESRALVLAPGDRGQSIVMDGARVPLGLLLGAAVSVMLIACVNVANMMLARNTIRLGEMAVRVSIGASVYRLVALLLNEALILALLALAVSLPLTHLILDWMQSMVLEQSGGTWGVGADTGVLAISIVVALASVLIFSLVPISKLARAEPVEAMKSKSARSTGGKAAKRFRTGLVKAQVALSMMLLVLAGLLAQSISNIADVDPGIGIDPVMTFSVSPERNGYLATESAALFDRIETEIAALPGVDSVAPSLVPVLAGATRKAEIRAAGSLSLQDVPQTVDMNAVGSGFFDTLEVTPLAGRGFRSTDQGLDRPKVAVVNQTFVERFGFGANAIGQYISLGDGGGEDLEIVGVVPDAKYDSVKDPIRAQVFRPLGQIAGVGTATFYIRHSGDPDAVATSLRAAVERLDPSLASMNMRTVQQQVRESMFFDLFLGKLVAALAALATLLAAVGLYGLLSYLVAERSREFGLRMALGASPGELSRMVLRQVAKMAVIGGVIGCGAALLLGRGVSALLFGVRAWDPLVLLGAVAMLAAIALIAAYSPARRASRVDPMIALRSD